MSIDIGDLRRVTAAFTDPNDSDAAVDPTALTLEVTDPSGEKTTYTYGTDVELVKDSIGNYHLDISVDMAGTWLYRWAGTGTAQAVEEGRFIVQQKATA